MGLNASRLRSLLKDYDDLSVEIRNKTEKALAFLIENPRHPSLQVKKIQGTQNIWEARIDLRHRITFQWEGNMIILPRIGCHDVIEKEAKKRS